MLSFRLSLAAALFALPFNAAPAFAHTAADYAAGVKYAPDFHDRGRAPATLPVRLAVTLAYEHEDELDALIESQSNPASPSFRQYLTNAQFNAYFAPSPAKVQSVIRTLIGAGLHVEQTFPNRTIIDAGGPSSIVEHLFQTEIHAGVQTGHGSRYMNVRDALMPVSLRGLVVAVSGLDDLVSFAPRYIKGREQRPLPQAIGGPLMGPNGGYGPLAFAQGYDEPIQQGYDGTGRSIANIMAGDINDTDLSTYLQYFGITPKFGLQRIAVDGGNLGQYDIETTLDVEAMTATSPGAQVYLYSFPNFTDTYAEDAYNKVVSDNLVDAANSSWGGCEADLHQQLGHAFALASNEIFKQGSAKGITFPIATGDQGWKTCHIRGMIDETTADSDPYALAVGGTTLQVDNSGNWVSEKGWRGSAGGISVLFPLPKYQQGVRHVVSAGRNIPDVALDADPATGFAELLRGHWFPVGGTSMASPLWVGLEGQIDEMLNTRIGFVNPPLYAIYKTPTYKTVIHDIVHGNNGGYRNLPGFDLVTGLGSPIGYPLGQALQTTQRPKK